jgi:DNA-binding response OmpR family regulator
MFVTQQKLHTSLPTPENIPILVVSPHQEDHTAVSQILRHGDWKISRVATCAEAFIQLKQMSFAVVICERDLPDGKWTDVLGKTAELKNTPAVLVVSRFADESLWADVLNLGGYDVLPKPYDRSEVTRVVGMAWRHAWSNWTGRKAQAASATSSSSSIPLTAQLASS